MSVNKLSGAQRRKLTKDKEEKESLIAKKIPRIDNFFVHREKIETSTQMSDSAISQPDEQILPPHAGFSSKDEARVRQADKIEDTAISIVENRGREENAPVIDANSSGQVPDFIDYSDPALWPTRDSEMIDFILRNPPKQQDPRMIAFSSSKRLFASKTRYCTAPMFFQKTLNGETRRREWILYSTSVGRMFCMPCKLFSTSANAFTEGFNDWKNDARIADHEKGPEHRENTRKFVMRSNVLGKIDSELHEQYVQECDYWRQVLARALTAIKFLASRGLAFRGTHEKFGSVNNGNYLGVLELMARNDPFLQNHIDRFGNPGRGNVSYLSKTICEEFIAMIYDALHKDLISEVKACKYYAISVDSTPDISHADQLTFIIRYVRENGEPAESFVQFIPIGGHSAAEIERVIVQVLTDIDLDIMDCRGQSYDNASNMSGCYGGVQAKIIERNPLALYVPCAAHSLNLVGQAAAECCLQATKFFMFVQHLYTFTSASTSRWARVKSKVENQPGMLLPKSLSGTRWSARAEACRALVKSWGSFRDALDDLVEDASEKPCTKAEAEGLSRQFGLLETAIMAVTWSDILERFEKTNKTLQSVNIDLATVVQLYDALKTYVIGLRDNFDEYELKAKELSQCNEYACENQRRRIRRRHFDEVSGNDAILDGRENMRVNTFLVILDRLAGELQKRNVAYTRVNARFGFLSRLSLLTDAEITTKCEELRDIYSTDLDDDFEEECLHFRNFIREMELPEDEINIRRLLKIIRGKGIVATFPNIDIALRMYLTLFSSNATGERSFSTLKRIKNYLRNTMGQDRLSSLAFLSANAELVDTAETNAIIGRFASMKARKRSI